MEEKLFGFVLNNPTLLGLWLLVGRLFMAVLFLTFGINKAINTPQIQQYMAVHHVPGQLVYLTSRCRWASEPCWRWAIAPGSRR